MSKPLYDTSKPGTSIPTKTAPPAASRAFPQATEPKGRSRFGPPPRAPQPTVQNRFNTDKHGKRKAMVPPSRVR